MPDTLSTSQSSPSSSTIEPTVLVKKADGSTIRVPLSRLKGKLPEKIAEPPQAPEAMNTPELVAKDLAKDKLGKIVWPKKDDSRLMQNREVPEHIRQALEDVKNFHKKFPGRSAVMETRKGGKINDKKIDDTETVNVSKEAQKKDTALAAITPNVHIFEEMARAKMAWNAKDHESLLAEKIEEHEADQSHPSTPDDRKSAAEKVIGTLSFRVSENLQKRLASLIGSRMKEIRNDMQLKEYAMRGEAEGGLAVTEAQAGELVDATRRALNLQPLGRVPRSKATTDLVAKIRERQMRMAREEKIIETSRTSAPSPSPDTSRERSVFPAVSFGPKPVLHDVIPPPEAPAGEGGQRPSSAEALFEPTETLDRVEAAETVGPAQEIRRMTLVDFRRLGSDPAKAEAIVVEKFTRLKEESFLLYLQSIDAWHESPLFAAYLSLIRQSIESSQPIDAVLGGADRGSLTPAEFTAVARIGERVAL